MTKTGFTKGRKWLLIVLLLAVVTAGGIFMFSMLGKSQEERRNREYEISLVNALKNSYEGIEEIKISNPDYTYPPGSWSCDVEIRFSDKQKIKYRIGHALNETQNYNGSITNEQDDFLNKRKGITHSVVVVYYSNDEKGTS
ncbi:hypothetical protein ACVRXQ_09160 [Streptococcus panodentis]|uniref:Uncharacterized protein n=1 Tax=Streptococcus panodentis TaxID=1581472 RepID=A0ABS5AWN8_9STRE|nr:hypothetical protein [Streptococcus panodentis]MBP2620992.1 hypothetical protein [Streptococcus panodentis]